MLSSGIFSTTEGFLFNSESFLFNSESFSFNSAFFDPWIADFFFIREMVKFKSSISSFSSCICFASNLFHSFSTQLGVENDSDVVDKNSSDSPKLRTDIGGCSEFVDDSEGIVRILSTELLINIVSASSSSLPNSLTG